MRIPFFESLTVQVEIASKIRKKPIFPAQSTINPLPEQNSNPNLLLFAIERSQNVTIPFRLKFPQ